MQNTVIVTIISTTVSVLFQSLSNYIPRVITLVILDWLNNRFYELTFP